MKELQSSFPVKLWEQALVHRSVELQMRAKSPSFGRRKQGCLSLR